MHTSSHGELMKDSTIEAIAMLDFWLRPSVMKLIWEEAETE